MVIGPTTKEPQVDYPTGDGKPVAETPIHRDNLLGLIEVLRHHFAGEEDVYVSGNMIVYYDRGQKRRHVSPDVLVARVPNKPRDAYFVWLEGRAPDLVIEITSPSTRDEDLEDKMRLYESTLRVPEYFLFDPKEEYLTPSLQGRQLIGGHYVPIEPQDGRLPSRVLGLHLERDGTDLRLYDPARGAWVPTPREAEAAAEAARQRAEQDRRRAEEENRRLAEALRQSEAEVARLRRELDALRRPANGS